MDRTRLQYPVAYGAIIGTALMLAASGVTVAQASPTDPDADDWVSIAVSPQNGSAGYGAAGSRDRALQIAMDECAQRSNGTRCVIAKTTEYGCVGFALNKDTLSWAGGVGRDKLSAAQAAATQLVATGDTYNEANGVAGSQCSSPVTPP